MERVKWTDKIKKCSCARKSGRRKNNAGTDKEAEKKLAGSLAKNDALEGMVNGKKFRGRRRYKMIIIIINGQYEDTKRESEGRVGEC